MSNFFYKGVSISTITNTTGSTTNAPGYNNFPVVAANSPILIPNDFFYYYNDPTNGIQQVSQLCTATSTKINSNGPQTIPAGCKSFRVVAYGGGGGGGCYGGNAGANYAPTKTSVEGNGGSGGDGGSGNGVVSLVNVISGQNIISVKIGNGGSYTSAGPNTIYGGNTFNNDNGNSEPSNSLNNNMDINYARIYGHIINGGMVNASKAGDTTSIIYGTTTIKATGGNEGNSGGGAFAKYNGNNDTPTLTVKSNKGSNGNAGNGGNFTNNIPGYNGPYFNTPAGGNGGNCSNDGGGQTAGTDGSDGYATFIWLYD